MLMTATQICEFDPSMRASLCSATEKFHKSTFTWDPTEGNSKGPTGGEKMARSELQSCVVGVLLLG